MATREETQARAPSRQPSAEGKSGDDEQDGNSKDSQGSGNQTQQSGDQNQGEKPQPGTNGGKGTSSRKGFRVLIILGTVVFVGALIWFLYWFFYARNIEGTDDAFIDGHIVQLSPRVAGTVLKVNIDDNSVVKAGEVMVQLDPADFETAVKQADGDVAAAEGKLQQAQSQIPVSEAQVAQADAALTVTQTNAQNAQQDLDRWLAVDPRARTREELDNVTAAQKSTAAQVEQAKSTLAAAKASVDNMKAAIVTAQGDLDTAKGQLAQANLNRSYCDVVAPCDGVITRKNVEPGMYIAVDQALFQIVEQDVWVTANFKETQLDHMQPGQKVTISVDAYPDRKLNGTVQSIQAGTGARFALLPAENATGNYVKIVQRVPVKIVLDPGQNDDTNHLLSPGMSVDPDVRIR